MNFEYDYMRSAAVGAVAILAGICTPAFAAPITLTGNDGVNKISGELVSFEDGNFIIDTTLGRMQIAANSVTCAGDGCPAEPVATEVKIIGSDTIGVGMMPLLLAGFSNMKEGAVKETANQNGVYAATLIGNGGFGDKIADFSITSSGSSSAFTGLLDKATQIGMSSRRIGPDEARRIGRSGGGNMIADTQEHIIAVDSVVVIVHQSNPIEEISMEDLDRIYSGQVTNWAALGGKDAPITVFGREVGSGTGAMFEKAIFEKSRGRRAPLVKAVNSHQEMATAVSKEENAIGFVGNAFQRGAKAVDLASSCGITIRPDSFTVKAEEYPLDQRLYLYNREDNMIPATQEFIDFATSLEADNVIKKAGFISLAVERDARKFQGNRAFDLIERTVLPEEVALMREMVVEILQYDRLSTTFRFASGSSSFETKAFSDLERLIEYVNKLPYAVELAFVGFSDSDGSFGANRALSIGRAQQVTAAVNAYAAGRFSDRVRLTSKGFGELSPSACNDTLEGKRTNRRVEVWIRRQ